MYSRLGLTTLLGTAVILSPGCRPTQSDTVPPGLPGTYTYVGAGSIAGASWDVHATLNLGADRQYRLVANANVKQEKEQETDRGTFQVTGDRLVLTSAGDKDTHELTIRGDSLLAGGSLGLAARMAMRAAGVSKPVFLKEPRSPTTAR
jgi:hypothetical protein